MMGKEELFYKGVKILEKRGFCNMGKCGEYGEMRIERRGF